ncbi:MAG: isocitrate/isopropylmalate family dehydrogenase, partial [Candidatus Marsarchaeota archaeon]|nr:isocitrate/isopropylmalate family dehydrogenase [Candidatus Marsarchaeota archaeon]
KIVLKGPLTTPVGKGERSLNVRIRQLFDLYQSIRPIRYFSPIKTPVKTPKLVDFVLFRENVEDVYAGIEWKQGTPEVKKVIEFLNTQFNSKISDDSGIGIKPISEHGSKRLVRAACDYAKKNKRKSVTLVHKGNIMKYTEGAFREWGYEVAVKEFGFITEEEAKQGNPENKIIIKDRIADDMFQQVLLKPAEYDVIATTNLNGDYLSDACAAQVGGIGIAPTANIGDNAAMFEATHGTSPASAGLNKANPTAEMLAGAMMLDYLGFRRESKKIVKAIQKTFRQKKMTYDLARATPNSIQLSTTDFTQAVIENLG